MPRNSFAQKVSNTDLFNVLVEFTCPAGEPPRKMLKFLAEYEKEKPAWPGMEIVGITVTQNPSGSVTASPTDVLAHVLMKEGLKGLEYVPHISAKGMNKGEIETVLKGLLSYGVENCFAITGDKPLVGASVFEFDSLNLLQYIRQMNADALLAAGPDAPARTLWAGAAVGLAKYEEGTCLQQLIKLEKKIHAGGAGFIITNLIFDARKVEDLFRYLKERQLNIPVFGNVFFLHEPAARRMLDEKLPGVYVSPDLYLKVRDESYEDYILRAAQQVAMWRDLGASGVDLGNVEDLGLLKKILSLAAEIGPRWREAKDNITFPPPMADPYYVYTPQGERTPLRDPDVPRKRLFMHWIHNLFFEPGSTGYEAIKHLFQHSESIRKGEGFIYDATKLVEYIGKNSVVKCQACGDCYLPENFFVCLMGECTKGLTNVPCGDSTIDGRCGVDTSRKCASRLVYDSARYFSKELESLYRLVNPPKDTELRQTSSFRSYFLRLDHHRRPPLIQIAELLHATLPKVKRAIEMIESTPQGFEHDNPGLEYIRIVIEAQTFCQPDYIDINVDDAGSGDPEKAAELMRQMVRLVCEISGGIPPCIDSSDTGVIRAGLEAYYRLRGQDAPRPLINSANRDREDFVWELPSIGAFNIVYMLMDNTSDASGMGEVATPEQLEQAALEFFHRARGKGFEPSQIFFDTTVIPLAIEFSRYGQPGYNYTSIETIRRVTHNPEMKGVQAVLGITNLVRDFPPGRKIGLLRAYLKLAMDAGLSAAIVDPRQEFGIKPPEDQEILDIVGAFLKQDGSPEAYDRMQEAYQKYKVFGIKKPQA